MGRDADEALLGRMIAGKFAIESFIGSGAMGQVYKARQVALEKSVALKVLHRDLATDPAFAARFHREAKAASRLDHPNSIRVIDFGQEADGLLYIAMELVDGRDLLKVLVTEWPLSGARIAGITMQALAALAVAHDMGVVHRDLKPENIMILEGTDDEEQPTDIVKVCDFGIAKITSRPAASKITGGGAGASGPNTAQGLLVGTPEYMSPEQGQGEPLDARSDLYSMGVILFQLLTGRVPFEAESAIGIVLKHVMEEPAKPSSINPAIDPRLEVICLKAMRKRRNDRYQTAREMRADLRAVLGDGTKTRVLGSTPTSEAPIMAHAATIQAAPVIFDSGPRGAPAVEPRSSSAGTPSGTMALPEIPVDRPKWLPYALVVVITMAAGVGLGLLVLSKQAAPAAGEYAAIAAPPTVAAPAADPTSSAASSAASTIPLRSPPDPKAIVPATPTVGISAPRHSSSSSPNAAVAVAPSVTLTTFNLSTAMATTRITRQNGVAAGDVRMALPTLKYTECYRDALRRTNKRIEGKVVIQLTVDAAGFFRNFRAVGPDALISNVGSCLKGATGANESPIPSVDPAGGTAEAEVVFTPE